MRPETFGSKLASRMLDYVELKTKETMQAPAIIRPWVKRKNLLKIRVYRLASAHAYEAYAELKKEEKERPPWIYTDEQAEEALARIKEIEESRARDREKMKERMKQKEQDQSPASSTS